MSRRKYRIQEKEQYMRNSRMPLLLLALTVVFASLGAGCSRFSAPTDEEVIAAIMDTGLYSGGVEKYTLTAPIVVQEKKWNYRDGSWSVKVKMSVSFKMADGKEPKVKEREPVFRLRKVKDGSGKTVWKDVPGA